MERENSQFSATMILSGALAGFAAWIYYFGGTDSYLNLKQSSQIDGALYQGITVALIGFNTFLGSIGASIFVSFFLTGGDLADSVVNTLPVTDLILATIIVLLAFVQFFIIYRPQDNWFKVDEEEEAERIRLEEAEEALIKENKRLKKLEKEKRKAEKNNNKEVKA